MKLVRVYSSPDPAKVHFVANLIQAEDIPAVVTGESLSAIQGAVGVTQSEVSVHEENRERAEAIVARFLRAGARPASPPSDGWTCPNCGEVIEPQFTDCWNCQTRRPDSVGNAPSVTEAPRPPPDPAVPVDIDCLRCQYNLRTLAIDGVCPECGHPVFPSVFAKLRELDRTYEPLDSPADLLLPCLDYFELHFGFPIESIAFAEQVWRESGYRDVDAITDKVLDKAVAFFGDSTTAQRALRRWNISTSADLRRLITLLVELRVLNTA
jgi:hypothetical protein